MTDRRLRHQPTRSSLPWGASTTEYLLGIGLFSVLAWAGLSEDWLTTLQGIWRYGLFLISSPTT